MSDEKTLTVLLTFIIVQLIQITAFSLIGGGRYKWPDHKIGCYQILFCLISALLVFMYLDIPFTQIFNLFKIQ